ncbi:MAG: soluble lytic murein transglycosylase-like protein [Cocleimonas sp.]|jgi:soluble lytic murein transglycosylase-like protein
MNSRAFTIIRSVAWSIALSMILIVGQSVYPDGVGLSNNVYAKSAKSPYKKTFARSKRIHSKKSRKRSSSGSCIQWNANKINEKAKKFNSYIDQYSRKYRIDKNLIKAVITAESCFRVKARSNKGAQGLMQLIPATAKRFGVNYSYKPKQNIRGGTKYLRFLMDRFKGDLKKVIASYNAGEGAVDKYKGIPPYKETKQYVKNVLQVYSVLNPPRAKPAVFKPPIKGMKAGRQGWQYNRSLAPHLYK